MLIRKMFSIPGANLLIPLIVLSTYVEGNASPIRQALMHIKEAIHAVINKIAMFIPFTTTATHFASITLFSFLTVIITYISDWVYKGHEVPYTWLIRLMFWMAAVILFVVEM
jgi:hypothetical protein